MKKIYTFDFLFDADQNAITGNFLRKEYTLEDLERMAKEEDGDN